MSAGMKTQSARMEAPEHHAYEVKDEVDCGEDADVYEIASAKPFSTLLRF